MIRAISHIESMLNRLLLNQTVCFSADTFRAAYPISRENPTHEDAFQSTRSELWLDWEVKLKDDQYHITKRPRSTKREIIEPKNGELF